jgi:hypothetical protein
MNYTFTLALVLNYVQNESSQEFVVANLSTFTTNTASKLDVFGHDGHTLSVDGAKICVLKKSNKISLRGFL